MSFTPDTARAATKTILEAISSLGVVHDYRRVIRTLPDVNALLFHAATSKINGAMISLPRITTTRDFGNPAQAGVMTSIAINVELFLGLEDASASQKTFESTIVFDVLQAINTRGRIDANASHQEPANATQIGYIALADATVLHYALIAFELRGRTAPS